MEIDFEKWYKCQSFNSKIQNLFQESIICYKLNANRAAYLLSFLAFQNILWERLLTAVNTRPNNQIPKILSNRSQELQDEDKWDSVVNTMVNVSGSNKVFGIDESIRASYMHYKNLRNDCAHAKIDDFLDSHILCLWDFIKRNNRKFTVYGGNDYLMQAIRDQFDLSKTDPNKEFDDLIHLIEGTVLEIEYPSFIEELKTISKASTQPRNIFDENSPIHKLVLKIADGNETFVEALFNNFIEKDMKQLPFFFQYFPNYITAVLNNTSICRKIIYAEIDKWPVHKKGTQDFIIRALECEDISESLKQILMKNIIKNGMIFQNLDFYKSLEKYGFEEVGDKLLFNLKVYSQTGATTGYEWLKSHENTVLVFLKAFGLNEHRLRCLSTIKDYGYGGGPVRQVLNELCEEECFRIQLTELIKKEDEDEIWISWVKNNLKQFKESFYNIEENQDTQSFE